MTFYITLILLVSVFMLAAEWAVFVKAGRPGWMAVIPVYNTLILLEIVNKPWWWILLMLIPGINLVFVAWTLNLLSKCFGKNEVFTLGLIFLPVFFIPILGFGSAQYESPVLDEE